MTHHWNWAQGSLFGFGVSGLAQVGWWHPQLSAQPVWINGGGFGLEASVFAITVDMLVIVLLWRWRLRNGVRLPSDRRRPLTAMGAS